MKLLNIDKIWGDRICANRFLLPLSVIYAALSGVLMGGSSVFNSWFNADLYVDLPATCGSLILVWAYSLAESIIAARVWWVAVCRVLLSLVALVLAFLLGYWVSIIVLAIVMIVLVLWFLSFMLMASGKGGSVSGGDSSESSTDDEYEVKGEDGSIRTIVEDRPGYGHFKDTGETLHQDGDRWIKD